MPDGIFVGRPRPIWKIILYSMISLGIYGRVWLYKTVNEIDGHKAWFLDLRLYRAGVILPVGGPYAVKWSLTNLLDRLLRKDPTARPVHRGALRWAGLVIWFPLYAVLVQRHLTPYWAQQSKRADLEARRALLAELRKTARSKDALEEVRRLEGEIGERERILEDSLQAALAIRDAKRARARAEADLAAMTGRKVSLWQRAIPARFRPKPRETGTAPSAAEDAAPTWRRRLSLLRRGKKAADGPPSPEPSEAAAAPSVGEASGPPPGERRYGFGRKSSQEEPAAVPAAANGPEPRETPEAETSPTRRIVGLLGRFKRKESTEPSAARIPEPPPEATPAETPGKGKPKRRK